MNSSEKPPGDYPLSPDRVGHYVYLYRDPNNQQVRYVGYGQDPQRAISHAGTSHNPALRRWLETSTYDLQVAGPYGSAQEGLNVEAALISAIKPTFNIHPGNGPKFRPLGVPLELADRVALPKLTDREIAIRCGGALFVRLAGGLPMTDGRPKVDPANPDTEVLAADIEKAWLLGDYVASWAANPISAPKVLLGIYGPIRQRFIFGAFEIDHARWLRDPKLHIKGKLWAVPLLDRTKADAYEFRGRLIDMFKFGRGQWEHWAWLDAQGTRRHPMPQSTQNKTA